ncbi:MAG: sigma factor [bacterium]
MAHLAARLAPASERDDVVQDALVAAWRKWTSYDAARGSPRSWLLAIVADQSGKSRRRRRPTVPSNCTTSSTSSTCRSPR